MASKEKEISFLRDEVSGSSTALRHERTKYKEIESKMKLLTQETDQVKSSIKELEKQIEESRESESKLSRDNQKLEILAKSRADKIDELEIQIRKFEDEEKEHEDLVSRLAQLATISKKKRG